MYHSSLSIHNNADFIVESSDGALTIYASEEVTPDDCIEAHIEVTLFGKDHLTGHQIAAILAKRLNEMLTQRMEDVKKHPAISKEEESWKSSVAGGAQDAEHSDRDILGNRKA